MPDTELERFTVVGLDGVARTFDDRARLISAGRVTANAIFLTEEPSMVEHVRKQNEAYQKERRHGRR